MTKVCQFVLLTDFYNNYLHLCIIVDRSEPKLSSRKSLEKEGDYVFFYYKLFHTAYTLFS